MRRKWRSNRAAGANSFFDTNVLIGMIITLSAIDRRRLPIGEASLQSHDTHESTPEWIFDRIHVGKSNFAATSEPMKTTSARWSSSRCVDEGPSAHGDAAHVRVVRGKLPMSSAQSAASFRSLLPRVVVRGPRRRAAVFMLSRSVRNLPWGPVAAFAFMKASLR